MKKISNILISVFMLSILFVSCNDILDVDSKRLATDDEYGLKSPNDSLYSMFGILSQMQKIADSYVLLGELRADLMDVTPNSDQYLREINDFSVSKANIYVNIKNYYSVINNCNYVIHNLDTAFIDKGKKTKLGQYAAVKSIRAWTYMQIALNFGSVKYYENPILTIKDAEMVENQTPISFEELSGLLIQDLLPLQDVTFPSLGIVDSYNTSFSYFPIRMLLGDLYLWKGEYENAANTYHDLMYKNNLAINKDYSNTWQTINNTISTSATYAWANAFTTKSYPREVMSTIACPTVYGQDYYLDSLAIQFKIYGSTKAINNWDTQTYFLNESSSSQGDLRKQQSLLDETYTNTSGVTKKYKYIVKNLYYDQNVVIYRSSLLYLRYAEAVNRLNKPKLAFAVLKYGLNNINLKNTKILPLSEKGEVIPGYMSFSDPRFDNNVGIRMRGLGNMDKDTTYFKLPTLPTMADSVIYVEDLIQNELALETAFEGNRFQDLMRIAIRRNDNSYLANIVADKHTGNKEAIKNKLLIRANWYLLYK